MSYEPTFDRNQMMFCIWDALVDAESIARIIDTFVDSLEFIRKTGGELQDQSGSKVDGRRCGA